MRRPGEVTILAIGALTNVAQAVQLESRFAGAVDCLVFMGAGLTYPEPAPKEILPDVAYLARPSHNVQCDVEAARRVFQSGMKISVVTNDVTTRVWWGGATVRRFLESTEPAETAAVAKLLQVWLKYRSRSFRRPIRGTCPHDPLTAAEAAVPRRFVKYLQGCVTICRDGSTSFTAENEGPHALGVDVDVAGFLDWMIPRLFRQCPVR
jgi:purine nucleosidase